MRMAIERQTAIVTGGASGIGRAICSHFASEGLNVAILDNSGPQGKEAAAELAREYPEARLLFKQCDVSSWESQEQVFGEVYNQFGSIDIVVANAGISERGKLIIRDEEKPSRPDMTTLTVNLFGVIYSVKLAIYYLSKNPPRSDDLRGKIICTASNAGLYPFPVAPMYGTSKHAVVGLVRSLARPLGLEQITINGLAPAVLATNIAPDKALFTNMILTPMSTLTRAVSMLCSEPETNGCIAEIHGDQVTYTSPQAYSDKDTATNIEMFWSLGYA